LSTALSLASFEAAPLYVLLLLYMLSLSASIALRSSLCFFVRQIRSPRSAVIVIAATEEPVLMPAIVAVGILDLLGAAG